MRTYDDLCDVMRACELPFARISWEPLDPSDIPPLPHALLVPQRTRHQSASDGISCHVTPYNVELYVSGSNLALEEGVQAALEGAGFNADRYAVPLGDGITEIVWTGLDCLDD